MALIFQRKASGLGERGVRSSASSGSFHYSCQHLLLGVSGPSSPNKIVTQTFVNNHVTYPKRGALKPVHALESTSEAVPGPSVVACFSMTYGVNFGECLKLVGAASEFGSWDVAKSVSLTWSEGNIWRGEAPLEPGTYTFKFVVCRDNVATKWEEGADRVLEVPSGPGKLMVECIWDQTSVTSITAADVMGTKLNENEASAAGVIMDDSLTGEERPDVTIALPSVDREDGFEVDADTTVAETAPSTAIDMLDALAAAIADPPPEAAAAETPVSVSSTAPEETAKVSDPADLSGSGSPVSALYSFIGAVSVATLLWCSNYALGDDIPSGPWDGTVVAAKQASVGMRDALSQAAVSANSAVGSMSVSGQRLLSNYQSELVAVVGDARAAVANLASSAASFKASS